MQHDGEQAKELQKHAVENSERDLDRILGNTVYGDSEPGKVWLRSVRSSLSRSHPASKTAICRPLF
ncbi:MAG: hypothetical protein VCB43_15265 [Myxococcota bacterium]